MVVPVFPQDKKVQKAATKFHLMNEFSRSSTGGKSPAKIAQYYGVQALSNTHHPETGVN